MRIITKDAKSNNRKLDMDIREIKRTYHPMSRRLTKRDADEETTLTKKEVEFVKSLVKAGVTANDIIAFAKTTDEKMEKPEEVEEDIVEEDDEEEFDENVNEDDEEVLEIGDSKKRNRTFNFKKHDSLKSIGSVNSMTSTSNATQENAQVAAWNKYYNNK